MLVFSAMEMFMLIYRAYNGVGYVSDAIFLCIRFYLKEPFVYFLDHSI